MRRRLTVLEDPFGTVVAFHPTQVVNITPWAKKVDSGVQDKDGAKLPPKAEIQKDACVLTLESPAGQVQPVVVKGTVRQVTEIVNQALKWAEEY